MKIAIGCHIMWYEIEMVEEYVDSLIQLVGQVPEEEHKNIYIDFYLNTNTYFEKPENDKVIEQVEEKFYTKILQNFRYEHLNVTTTDSDDFYFIGDYRRDFNNMFAPNTDFLIWGESDCLLPKETYQVLKSIYDYTNQNNIYRYIVTFAVRKMWDDSWKVLEHPDFTDKPFIDGDTENWWSLRYTMNRKEIMRNNHEIENYSWGIIQDMIEGEVNAAFKLRVDPVMPSKKEIKTIIRDTVKRERTKKQ